MITIIIRWSLSLILIGGIYTETGIFTTIFALLVTIGLEIMAYEKRKIQT